MTKTEREELKSGKQRLGLSYREIAASLNVTGQYVESILNGRVDPKYKMVVVDQLRRLLL